MVKLLDTNVLIALARPEHVAHEKVRRWYKESGAKAWATCPLTECGFVRIVCNPAFFAPAPDVAEALALLMALTQSAGHRFWAADLPITKAAELFGNRLLGHQQVTDAYLLALAIEKKGEIVSLDRGLATLAGSEYAENLLLL